MPDLLQLAALAFLGATAAAPAQIHSPQVNIHRHHNPDDLSWMLQYLEPTPDGSENRFVWDPRLESFLKQNLTAPQSFWGQNKSLSRTALEFLGGPPGRVFLDSGRYLNANACVLHFCPNRGLLWIDTALDQPLVVFSAIDWITENRATDDKDAAYTLWVFPNRAIEPARIPGALIRSIRRWTGQPSSGSADLQNITRAFLVDPDGTPHQITPSDLGAHNALPAETHTTTTATPAVDTPADTKVNP